MKASELLDFAGWPGPQKCDCGEVYPIYGMAPHECYWRKGPQFTIGQSTLLPIDDWTELFVPELEDGEGWDDFVYPGACGVFYCSVCQQDRYAKAWAALCERIGPPPTQAIEARSGETEGLSIRAKMATRYWRAAEKFHDRWPNYSPETRAHVARAWGVGDRP